MVSKIGLIIDRGSHKYTVLEEHPDGKVVIECSICSKDLEVYPRGCLKLAFRKLKGGATPCGCKKTNVFKTFQYKIFLNRKGKEDFGYEILTNIDNLDNINGKTMLELRNTYTSDIVTRQVKTVLEKGFKSDVKKLTDKTESFLNERGIKNLYAKGTDFYRNPVKNKEWFYRCGVCSKDEYVTNNLCNGIFKIDITHLCGGSKACRCVKTFKWSLAQREYQVRQKAAKEGHKFIRWVDKGKTSSHCRFEWQCKFGHTCEMSVDNYRRGKGCKHCAVSTGNGYFPSRRNEEDYLYVMKINEDKSNPKDYFKVGRSFNPVRRANELKGEVRRKDDREMDFYPLIYLKATHGEIYDLEQKIHKKFEDYKPVNGYGSSELIHNSVFLEVLDYLKSSGFTVLVSDSFQLRVLHEIKMYIVTGGILDLMEDMPETSDTDTVKLMKCYFENKIWNRIFSYSGKKERIRGESVEIKTQWVQRNKQTGEIVEVVNE